MRGVLALTGGDELHLGNEAQDRFLVEHSARGPAYILATANRKHPDMAVDIARRWFAGLGKEVRELPVRSRADADSAELARQAAGGGMFYLLGGNPGHIVDVLRHSPVWKAIHEAWRKGSALGGSSAGAMALCRWTLVDGHPVDALNAVHQSAVLPHYNSFGQTWVSPARSALPPQTWLLGLDERTALVLHEGKWRAMGAATVTILRGDHKWSARNGKELPLTIGYD